MITAIAAIGPQGVLGDDGTLPWRLRSDLRRFRCRTQGKPVIMGRRTQQSLPGPLPGRLNIVVSRSRNSIPGFLVCPSPEAAIQEAWDRPELMIIGGGQLYAQTAPLWDRLLLTVVLGEFQGQTRFPLQQLQSGWTVLDSEFVAAGKRDSHPHWFLELERDRDGEFCYNDWQRSLH